MTAPADEHGDASENVASDVGAGGLLRHARNYLTAGAITAAAGLVTVPLLTRLLSVEEYGYLGIFHSMVSVFAIVLGLNLHGALSRYILERTEDLPDYLRTTLSFLGVAIALELVLFFFLRDVFGGLFEVPGSLFFAAVLVAASQILWNLNWKYLVASLQSGAYARLNAMKAVAEPAIGIALIVGIYGWQMGALPDLGDETRETLATGLHWGQIGGIFSVGLVFAFVLGRRLWRTAAAGRANRRHLRYALGFGLPLMPHTLSTYVLNLFDVIIINMVVGAEPAGLYAFAYAIGAIMRSVVGAMNQAWQPIFTDHRSAGRYDKIGRLAGGYARYVYCAAVALVLFAEEIAMLLADDRYDAALPLVPVIVFGYVALFLYNLYANHSFYLRRTGLISLATVVASAVNIGLNFWLIPIYGFVAAAWTTLASYLVLLLMHYLTARVVLGERVVPPLRVMPGYLLAAGVSAGYVFAADAIDHYWITLVAVKLPIAAAAGLIAWRTRRDDGRADAAETEERP